MPVLPVTELGRRSSGQGPDLVLLHGVGAGPDTFQELARLLAEDHRVLVLRRPGGPDGAVALAEQVTAVGETVEALAAGPVVLIGVSGGATLGLACGIAWPELVTALVLHEPLVGRHAPALHRRFAVVAADAARNDAAALAAVRGVVGEDTWQRLDEVTRRRIAQSAPWARREIPLFAAFDPSEDDLGSLRGGALLTTLGADSGPDRQEAAVVLADLAGADVVTIPGAGNAVQLDAPAPFADAIRSWRRSPIGCGS